MDPIAGRILLVEDEPALVRIYTRALVSLGFQVTHAGDGAVGIERLMADDYDLVLSDVCMPRLSGLDVLETARRYRPDVPVILMTAQLDAEAYGRARDMGTVRYLLKPVSLEHLTNAVLSAAALRASYVRRDLRRRAR